MAQLYFLVMLNWDLSNELFVNPNINEVVGPEIMKIISRYGNFYIGNVRAKL